MEVPALTCKLAGLWLEPATPVGFVTMVSPWFPEHGAQVVWSAATHQHYWCVGTSEATVVANAATGDSNI